MPRTLSPMTNNLYSIDAAAGRREPQRPNAHIAELREVFALACHFGLTSAERDEWQGRFDRAIAALEAQLDAPGLGYRARGARPRW